MANSPTVKTQAETWTTRSGRSSGLSDLTGDLRLEINSQPVGILHVENGAVSVQSGDDATALVAVDCQRTLLAVLGGSTHPFVANLQGRLRVEGDRALALRVLLGLRSGSPWSELAQELTLHAA